MNELEKRAKHHKKFQQGCLFPFGSAQGCAESLTGSADELHGGDGDSSNNSLSEARKNLITKGSKMLSEAVERGIKVYEVEKDGPPEVGRQIIAFVDSHEEYTILTRQDKEYINKQKWDDKEGHKSSDGEYYAGKNGWIYALGYSKYIYLDELDLIPQKHFDKVAREIEAANKQKVDLEQKLARIYGDELASKIAPEVISVTKGGRRVELPHYYSYLVSMPKHRDALKGLEGALLRHIDKDTVKQVMAKTPGVVNNYPGSEQYKLSEDLETPILERWSDDALDELSKKPKDEWTEADWDTYNYCKNANAERDYYDSLDESSSDDYYNYITKMKTADSDNKLVNSEESIEDFVKRVTSGNDSIHYVADNIEQSGDNYYLVGFKSDMSRIEFLLGTPGEDASERNVKHILKNPHWHISLSLKDKLASMYLEKDLNESAFKSGDRYYGGLPAEPDYKGPGKDAKYHKEVTEYFLQLANTHPEYRIKGRSPISIVIETPYGIKNIDLTKFDSCEDSYDALDAARDQLFEEKKKKVKGAYLKKDAGNVEHNVAAFNHAMSASESPSTNPCGPMGESVGTKWVNFYYNGKKIGGYTAAEEFDGEREDTLSLLAYDNNCDPDDIEVRIENDASNVVKEDFAKTKDYEYYKVAVPSPTSKGTCSFGVHEHNDGHCSISGIHPYDDGDYHWATSKDGVTFNIYVGNPGKLVKKFVSDHNGYEDICSELAKLDNNVKSVMIHW